MCSLALNGSQYSEFETIDNATGNHSTLFPQKIWNFTNNKGKKKHGKT